MQPGARRHLGVALGAVGQARRHLEVSLLARAHAEQREVPARHDRATASTHRERRASGGVEHAALGTAEPAGVLDGDGLPGAHHGAAGHRARLGEGQPEDGEGLERVAHAAAVDHVVPRQFHQNQVMGTVKILNTIFIIL